MNVTELGNARGAGRRFWQDNKWPCQEPPWGTLNAVDLNRGEIVWTSTLGLVEELMEKGVPQTGTPNLGGSIVTAGGLVFVGGTNDRRFRAFDSASGEELWVDLLEANAHATPMTFWGEKTGKQYVVIAAGGGNVFSDVTSDGLVGLRVAVSGWRCLRWCEEVCIGGTAVPPNPPCRRRGRRRSIRSFGGASFLAPSFERWGNSKLGGGTSWFFSSKKGRSFRSFLRWGVRTNAGG